MTDSDDGVTRYRSQFRAFDETETVKIPDDAIGVSLDRSGHIDVARWLEPVDRTLFEEEGEDGE